MAVKNPIIERISLEGGGDIEKQLAQLGEAGKAAFTLLKTEADKLAATNPLQQFVNRQIRAFKLLEAEAVKVGASYQAAGAAASAMARNITIAAAAVGGAATGFVAFVAKASATADDTEKAAEAAGLAIDKYGELKFVFQQSGLDTDQLGLAMKKLNQNVSQAADGSGAGAKLFDQLGISVKGANGQLLPTDQILQTISDKFEALPDGPKKSALAVQLFGKSGTALIPILDAGGAAMQRLEDKAVSLNLVLTKEQAEIGKGFTEAFNALKATLAGTFTSIGLQFAKPLGDAFAAVTDIIAKNRNAILAFSQTIADQVGPLLKDFVNLLEGNDDAVVNKNLIAARDTIVSIGQALGIVAAIVNTAFGILVSLVQPFVDIVNEAFGTKFTAQAVIITGILLSIGGVFGAIGKGIEAVFSTWGLLVKAFGTAAPLVAAAITVVVGSIAVLEETIESVGDTITAWGKVFADAGAQAAGSVTLIAQNFTNIWAGATTVIANLFAGLGKSIEDTFTSMFLFIKTGIDTATGWIGDLIKKASDAAAALASALGGSGGSSGSSGSSGDDSGGFAGGGLLRGRGTGTSDSMLARVSTGEFVMRAAAVRRYGVGVMAALNGLRVPSGLSGFASGGLVSAFPVSMGQLPAFAGGGPVGRPLTLSIGADVFEGLIAPETVANKLARYATGRQIRSAGRRPSWSN